MHRRSYDLFTQEQGSQQPKLLYQDLEGQQFYRQQQDSLPNGHVPSQPHGTGAAPFAYSLHGSGFGMVLDSPHVWGVSGNGMHGFVNGHRFGGFGRPDSSTSLGNAEAASSWSADSAVPCPGQQHQVGDCLNLKCCVAQRLCW
jgi:hypothetical protein